MKAEIEVRERAEQRAIELMEEMSKKAEENNERVKQTDFSEYEDQAKQNIFKEKIQELEETVKTLECLLDSEEESHKATQEILDEIREKMSMQGEIQDEGYVVRLKEELKKSHENLDSAMKQLEKLKYSASAQYKQKQDLEAELEKQTLITNFQRDLQKEQIKTQEWKLKFEQARHDLVRVQMDPNLKTKWLEVDPVILNEEIRNQNMM